MDLNYATVSGDYLGEIHHKEKTIGERMELFSLSGNVYKIIDGQLEVSFDPEKKFDRPKGGMIITDGFESRLSENDLVTPHLNLGPYDDPSSIIQQYERFQRMPEGKLSSLKLEEIRDFLSIKLPDLRVPKKTISSHKKLVNYIMDAYKARDNPQLVRQFDRFLKHDDATMIFFYLEDHVQEGLNRLKLYDKTASSSKRKKSSPDDAALIKDAGDTITSLENKLNAEKEKSKKYRSEIRKLKRNS